MTHVNNDGTNKFEAVYTVRVRFNVNSDQLDIGTFASRVVRDEMIEALSNSPRLQDDDLASKPRNGWTHSDEDTVRVTFKDIRVEAVDHASPRAEHSSIWHDGLTWNTLSHAVSRWNDNWRVVNHYEDGFDRYRHLDTEGGTYGDRRIILPTVPHAVLRNVIAENRNNIVSDNTREMVQRREQVLRQHIIDYIEGVFEDGLETAQLSTTNRPEESTPEPF